MRFNWGHGLTLGMLCFIAYILYFLFRALSMDFDLETEDYYAKEIKFQEQIDKSKNYENLDKKMTVQQFDSVLTIDFPHKVDSGMVHMYRSSDKNLDRIYHLSSKDGAFKSIDRNDLQRGRYQLRVDWSAKGSSYYFEKNLFIQ